METASRHLQAKFGGARALFERAGAAGVGGGAAQALAGELAALEARYLLTTSHLFVLAAGRESERVAAAASYARLLAAEDFAGCVDRLVERGEACLRAAGATLRDSAPAARRGRGRAVAAAARARRPGAPPAAVCADLQRLLDVYPRDAGAQGRLAEGATQAVDYERCPACGGDMAIDAGRSELRCVECSALRELVGTVFDDAQFYSQEGQKAKSGTFNPNRHFQFWWMHILAREPEEEIGDKDDLDNLYGERLLAALRAIVTRDQKILRLLTVNDIRAMLRELERTDLNKNVPLILKKLTGVGPPQLGEAVAVRVENLFTKAIETGERVRRVGRVNRNYYPYYIYKILDLLLEEPDTESRRILYYIYIQSKETVEADDVDWEMICDEMPDELTYRPTDRTLGLKYRPV